MLAVLEISLRLPASGSLEHGIQILLPYVAFESATPLCSRTPVMKLTVSTGARGCYVFVMISLLVIMASSKGLSSRAAKAVRLRLVAKRLLGKDPPLTA